MKPKNVELATTGTRPALLQTARQAITPIGPTNIDIPEVEVARAPTRFGLRPRPGAAGVVQLQRQVLLSSRVNLSPLKQVSNSGEPLPGLRSQRQSSTSIQSSKTQPNQRLQQHAQTSGKTVIRETLIDTNDYESESKDSDNDNMKSLTKPSTSGEREADASCAHDDSLNASVQDLSLHSAVSLPLLKQEPKTITSQTSVALKWIWMIRPTIQNSKIIPCFIPHRRQTIRKSQTMIQRRA